MSKNNFKIVSVLELGIHFTLLHSIFYIYYHHHLFIIFLLEDSVCYQWAFPMKLTRTYFCAHNKLFGAVCGYWIVVCLYFAICSEQSA